MFGNSTITIVGISQSYKFHHKVTYIIMTFILVKLVDMQIILSISELSKNIKLVSVEILKDKYV